MRCALIVLAWSAGAVAALAFGLMAVAVWMWVCGRIADRFGWGEGAGVLLSVLSMAAAFGGVVGALSCVGAH